MVAISIWSSSMHLIQILKKPLQYLAISIVTGTIVHLYTHSTGKGSILNR